jgi:glycosyltransferase involved in cell wall biosynthesis
MRHWRLGRSTGGRPLHRIALTTLWWGLLQQAKRRFDFFVCATPQIAQCFPPSRSVEVRNYPRLEMFPESASQQRRGRDLVFAGLVSETRGAIEMLDALAQVHSPGIRLKLFGTIATDDLRSRMEKHPAWSRVDYVGHRPWREVLNEYGRALGGLLLYESTPEQLHCMPVKLFEFLLGGVPVIASDIPFWRELLDGNPAVTFVDIKDPKAIAAAIERIAADPELAASMGQAGQEHARARFNWDAEGAKLVAGYARVCGNQS